MSKLEDGVDVHKLTQVNKICAKTCTPNCYALQILVVRFHRLNFKAFNFEKLACLVAASQPWYSV